MNSNIAYAYECMITYCIWKIIPDFNTDLEKLEKRYLRCLK